MLSYRKILKPIVVTLMGIVALVAIAVAGLIVVDNKVGLGPAGASLHRRFRNYTASFSNYPPYDKTVKIDSTTLPVIYINYDGKISKGDYAIAEVRVVDEKGDTDYDGKMKIRYRGHASFTAADKKSYALRPYEINEEGGG